MAATEAWGNIDMRRVHWAFFVAVLVACPIKASAQGQAAVEARSEQAGELRAILSDHAVMRMDPASIEAEVMKSGELALMLRGDPFHFRMEPRDLRSPRYHAESTGPDGVRRPLPLGKVLTYRGLATVGQEDIQGRFTIAGDTFEGVVFAPGDYIFIESLKNFVPAAGGDEWVVYRQSDIRPGQGWRCGVSHRLHEGKDRLEVHAVGTDRTTTYTVEVATEADYEYVQHWGSAASSNREILAVLNQVEGVYEQELKLKLAIVYQHAWSVKDDPYTGTDGPALLEQFTEYWNDEFYYSKGYDLAHLWTARETLKDEDGEEINLGGIAWLGTVCQIGFGSSSYGVTKHLTYGLAQFLVPAHEIGHNFNATHPDQEEFPPTSCKNTIMQSKGTSEERLTFCSFSREQIRDYVSDYNFCLGSERITLNAPSNVTAKALGPHRVLLTWSNSNGDNAYGYNINRREQDGEWKSLVYQFDPAQEFIDGSVSPKTTYNYRIFAYNNGIS